MYTIESLIQTVGQSAALIKGKWVPARPLVWDHGCWWSRERLKDAWEVFRGRADAVKWPGQ